MRMMSRAIDYCTIDHRTLHTSFTPCNIPLNTFFFFQRQRAFLPVQQEAQQTQLSHSFSHSLVALFQMFTRPIESACTQKTFFDSQREHFGHVMKSTLGVYLSPV